MKTAPKNDIKFQEVSKIIIFLEPQSQVLKASRKKITNSCLVTHTTTKVIHFKYYKHWLPDARHYNPRFFILFTHFLKSKNVFQGAFFLKFWPYVWLVTDFLIDGRRSLIWELRLGVFLAKNQHTPKEKSLKNFYEECQFIKNWA